jgi:hypothetical protein
MLIVISQLHYIKRSDKFSFRICKHASIALIFPMLMIGVLATKNYIQFDKFMLSTGSGAALWLGSRADTEGDDPPYRQRPYGTEVITHGLSHLSVEGDKLLLQEAKKNIQEASFSYAWWNIKKIGRLTIGNNFAWFYPYNNVVKWYSGTSTDVLATTNMIFQIILASSIVVFGTLGLITNREPKPFWLVITGTICYLVIFSIPFLVIQRYGLPLVMLLSIPASNMIVNCFTKIDKRQLRRTLFSVLIILCMTMLIAIGK